MKRNKWNMPEFEDAENYFEPFDDSKLSNFKDKLMNRGNNNINGDNYWDNYNNNMNQGANWNPNQNYQQPPYPPQFNGYYPPNNQMPPNYPNPYHQYNNYDPRSYQNPHPPYYPPQPYPQYGGPQQPINNHYQQPVPAAPQPEVAKQFHKYTPEAINTSQIQTILNTILHDNMNNRNYVFKVWKYTGESEKDITQLKIILSNAKTGQIKSELIIKNELSSGAKLPNVYYLPLAQWFENFYNDVIDPILFIKWFLK